MLKYMLFSLNIVLKGTLLSVYRLDCIIKMYWCGSSKPPKYSLLWFCMWWILIFIYFNFLYCTNHSSEVQFIWNLLRQEKKKVTSWYKWLLNRGDRMDRFDCTSILPILLLVQQRKYLIDTIYNCLQSKRDYNHIMWQSLFI
jgi:hypothetical protein